MKDKEHKNKGRVKIGLLCILLAVFLVSGAMTIRQYLENKRTEDEYRQLAEQAARQTTEATRRIQQKSLLTLGGFGGYIVLGFPHPIPNVTGEMSR